MPRRPTTLLLWNMVRQGPAVLAAGAGRVGCLFVCFLFVCFLFCFVLLFFFISSILSSFSNASSLGRRLDILKFIVVSAVITQR